MNRETDSGHRKRCAELAEILIPAIRFCARRHGYAVGVHGSLAYDIDLIACPWRKCAADAKTLAFAVQKVAEAVNGAAVMSDRDGAANPDYFDNGSPGSKPHGRLCWSFHLGGGPYIDLSVMPTKELSDEG